MSFMKKEGITPPFDLDLKPFFNDYYAASLISSMNESSHSEA